MGTGIITTASFRRRMLAPIPLRALRALEATRCTRFPAAVLGAKEELVVVVVVVVKDIVRVMGCEVEEDSLVLGVRTGLAVLL